MTYVIKAVPDDVSINDGNIRQEFLFDFSDGTFEPEHVRIGSTVSMAKTNAFMLMVGLIGTWASMIVDGELDSMNIIDHDDAVDRITINGRKEEST